MNESTKINKELNKTERMLKWGCLILAAVLILPILLFITYFMYEMKWKETELVSMSSPNGLHTITVVEKGSAAFFGPSKVRIKSDVGYIDRMISNDGATLYPDNVSVSWKNDYEATIILYGDEQIPEVVKFHVEGDEVFETGQFDLGSFTFKTSESPNLINMIELREVTKSKGPAPHSTVKIYYGERGTVLERFVEHIPSAMYTPDHFNIEWMNDEYAVVEVMRENDDGGWYIEEVIEIEINSTE